MGEDKREGELGKAVVKKIVRRDRIKGKSRIKRENKKEGNTQLVLIAMNVYAMKPPPKKKTEADKRMD